MGMPQMSFQSNRPPPPYSHMDPPDLFFPLPLVRDLAVLPVVLPLLLPVVLPLVLLFPLELPLDGFPAGLDLVVVVDLGLALGCDVRGFCDLGFGFGLGSSSSWNADPPYDGLL